MPCIIRPGDTVVFTGDSITGDLGWYAQAGGLIDQWGALGASLTIVNTGVSGNRVADIEADVAGRITDYNPDVVVIEVGVNDATHLPPTDPEDFRDSYDSILSQIASFNPAIQVACVSILCAGEKWTTVGPMFDFNNFDDIIDGLNVEMAASAAGAGAAYCDIRTPAALYESLNNVPFPGVSDGFLTSDEIHPNATGRLLMGTWSIPYFTVPQESRLLVTGG